MAGDTFTINAVEKTTPRESMLMTSLEKIPAVSLNSPTSSGHVQNSYMSQRNRAAGEGFTKEKGRAMFMDELNSLSSYNQLLINKFNSNREDL